ncbi:MAG TPA: HAMP domain-containing sensor histidine kinase, partial [Candidatus Sulfotelmatobacter sp.]|nr:HAMP domain-containing sensor histidine kinase [Candidatus Sulfotelmatobacter sp.]
MANQEAGEAPDREIREEFIKETNHKWRQVALVTCSVTSPALLYFIWQDYAILHMPVLFWRLLFLIPNILVVIAALFFKDRDLLISRLFTAAKFCATAMMMGILAQSNFRPISIPGSMAVLIIVLFIIQYGWQESFFAMLLPWLGLVAYSLIVHSAAISDWLPAVSNPGVVCLVALPLTEVQYRLRFAEFSSRYQLSKALKKLERIDRSKDEFLSIVTHDLKSPLTSVLGYADILLHGREGPLSEKQSKDIGIIKKQGGVLLALIDTILDYSRAEFGKLIINKEEIPLVANVRQLLEQVKAEADEKRLSVKAELPAEEIKIKADKIMIDRVIANLLGNAIKYTQDQGEIALSVSRRADAVQVSVKDTGRGVEKDKLKNLFEKFYLIDTAGARK